MSDGLVLLSRAMGGIVLLVSFQISYVIARL